MKKVLIIGASILQLPAIKKAKEMGLKVAVADYNPQAIGIPYADKFFNASTIDIEAICKVAEEYHPDGILTLATDMPMRSIAAATTKLGLPGITLDTAIKSTDKGEMIKAFKEHSVAAPWFYLIEDAKMLETVKGEFTYPCIMKPTDNSGSRGVVLIKSANELAEAYSYSHEQSRGGTVLVEEYLQGHEVSVEVIVYKGKAHILQVTDKLTTGAPNFVEMGHSQPSMFVGADLEAIHQLATNAVVAVGIESGPAHVEIMVTKNGMKMIELGARMGGDCITTHLVPLSTGIDMIKATIDISLGNVPDLEPKKRCGSAIRYFDAPCGTIKEISGVEEAEKLNGIEEITFTKYIGDESTVVHNSLDRIGMVIAQGYDAKDAVAKCENAMNIIKIEVE